MAYKLVNTKKLFFSQYPYKVTLNFIGIPTNKRHARFSETMNDIWVWIKKTYNKTRYETWKKDWDIRVSESYNIVHIYFRNYIHIEQFMARFNEYIEIYERPENNEQLELLKNEDKIIIRDSLYYNMFRWRVQCKIKNFHDCDEISEWLNEYGENAGWDSYKDWVFTSSSGSIYLKDEKQILLLRLGIGNKMKFVEKVILKSELEALNG